MRLDHKVERAKCQPTAQVFQNFPATAIEEVVDEFIEANFRSEIIIGVLE
jgi:hypothetical protein